MHNIMVQMIVRGKGEINHRVGIMEGYYMWTKLISYIIQGGDFFLIHISMTNKITN